MAELVKDRCTVLDDFWQQSYFFFSAPKEIDATAIKSKWNADRAAFFTSFSKAITSIGDWNALSIESTFKQLAEQASIKPGELQLPLRLMLVGGKFGPPVFEIAALLGKEETTSRILFGLHEFNK